MSNFQGALEDAQNWFVGSADIKNACHQMRIPSWLQAFFALFAVLASEVGRTGKTYKNVSRRFFDLSCPPEIYVPRSGNSNENFNTK